MNGMLGLNPVFNVSANVDVESANQSLVYFSEMPWSSPMRHRAGERQWQAAQATDDGGCERDDEQQRELDLTESEDRTEQDAGERRESAPEHPRDCADDRRVDAGNARDSRRVHRGSGREAERSEPQHETEREGNDHGADDHRSLVPVDRHAEEVEGAGWIATEALGASTSPPATVVP